MRKRVNVPPYLVGLSIVLIVAVFSLLPNTFIDQVELKLLDMRFRLFPREPEFSEVAVIAIDRETEDALGRWPWDRDAHARLIDIIAESGPAVIGIDLVFSRPQETRIPEFLARLGIGGRLTQADREKLERLTDYDRVLADALGRAGNVVLGYYFYTEEQPHANHLPAVEAEYRELLGRSAVNRVVSGITADRRFSMPRGTGVEMSLPAIAETAGAAGFLNIYLDSDGVLRRSNAVINYEGDWYPSFPVEIARLYAGAPETSLWVDDYGISRFHIGDRAIPVDPDGSFVLDYTSGTETFPVYSYVDVLEGRVPAGEFEGKIVLVGLTEPGLVRDTWTTPAALSVPGVKVQALAVATMIEGRFIRADDTIALVNLLLLLLCGIVIAFFVIRFSRAVYGALLAALIFAGYVVLAFRAFNHGYIWLNMVYPLGCIIAVYLAESLFHAVRGELRAREIKNAFQSYVPPAVVDELIRDPDKLRLGGERKPVSVLFSDIKSFTAIAEKLAPEELAHSLNRYLTPMTEIVFRRSGTLDKYIGDSLMAFFGAPLPLADHAMQATLAAMEMVQASRNLDSFGGKGVADFEIGVGINTGDVSVGNMGSVMRFDYTVIGDNVNVAQRLEQLTRDYGNSILISESTFLAVRDRILCREIDTAAVKGRLRPVRIYEPLASRETASEKTVRLVTLYEKGLALFRQGMTGAAAEVFSQLLVLFPDDGPAALFLEKCRAAGNSRTAGQFVAGGAAAETLEP